MGRHTCRNCHRTAGAALSAAGTPRRLWPGSTTPSTEAVGRNFLPGRGDFRRNQDPRPTTPVQGQANFSKDILRPISTKSGRIQEVRC